ncbi:MAG TPA: hypothetical protein VM778_08390, partial [Gemmatimonadota bacterium]|nr:hypothetical protein [Gemmatimonadota bacterium]
MSAGTRPARAGTLRYAVILAPPALLIAALPLLSRLLETPIGDFTRDVFSTAELPVYIGLVSNVGIFMWGATAAVCGFAWWVAPGPRWRGRRAWLLATAVWSGVLMADDFFMFHEWIFPKVTGLDEKVVLGAYGAALATYLWAFRALLAESPVGIGAAVALFGV